MPPKTSAKPAGKKAGRPRRIPADATPRTIRMTDDERAAVIDLLKRLRAATGKNV